MMRVLARWIRVVLPFSGAAWLCVIVDLIIESIYLVNMWRGFAPNEFAFRNFRIGVLTFFASIYGTSRVTVFHPIFNDQYRKWLESSPWSSDKPLPNGPVQLMPQDVVVVGALMFLSREPSAMTLGIPLGFLMTYLVFVAIAARASGDWLFAYLLAIGMGAVGLAAQATTASCLVALSICPIALIAVQRSLRRFPWEFDWKQVAKMNQSNLDELGRDRLGWPHDFLSPAPPKIWLPYPDGVGLSLLFGWYAFVFHWHGGSILVFTFSIMIISIAMLVRLYNFMRAHLPPISLWGRLWTRRWIIPSYDVILVAPLLAVLVVAVSQFVAVQLTMNRFGGFPRNAQFHWAASLCSSCGIALGSLFMCVMGPILERWRLSAAHRIVFDAANKQSISPFVEL